MTNTTIVPLENAYKTVLTASIDAVTTTIIVDVAPSFTVPVGKKIPAVLDPKNNFREVVFITAVVGSTLTVERGEADYDGGPSTANAHSAGSTIVITNPFNIFKDYADAIDSKLDNDGGNPTTTWDLDVSGSNFRFRLDVGTGDMLFTDDNQAEVSLSTLAAAAGVDDKAKVSAADTTSSYLATKLVAGAGGSLTILNPGGNETLEVGFDSTGAGVSDHEVYTPAFLTGGNAPEAVVAIWDSVSDGAFSITIDGVVREMTGLNFQTPAVTSMAEVAAVIQAGIRTVTGSTETCTWSGAEFVVSSALTTAASAITVTSTIAVPAGTDISGAGGAYMDCDAGSTAVITAAVLDPTADAGQIVLLAASGNINGSLVDANTLGLTAKGSLATASDATTKAELTVGSDGEFLSADSTAPGGLAWVPAPVEFVGVGSGAPKNINYQINQSGLWYQGALGSFIVNGAEIESSSTNTIGYIATLMGPTLDQAVGDQMRFNNVFTKLTVDWWQASKVGRGDSQYGIGSVYWEGFTRVDVNSPGCFFFWDTGGLTLSIVTANGAANTTTALVGPPSIDETQNYRVEYSPGVDCKFYLNGVLVGTHTTHLPDGVANNIYFGGGLDDNGGADDFLYMGPCTVSIDI